MSIAFLILGMGLPLAAMDKGEGEEGLLSLQEIRKQLQSCKGYIFGIIGTYDGLIRISGEKEEKMLDTLERAITFLESGYSDVSKEAVNQKSCEVAVIVGYDRGVLIGVDIMEGMPDFAAKKAKLKPYLNVLERRCALGKAILQHLK